MESINYKTDFAIFILSHNRANKIDTLKMLLNAGYNGDWFVVISTDDKQINEYKSIIPSKNLLIFDKESVLCDTMVSSKNKNRSSSLYARNYIISYVKNSTSYKYIVMADDDIKKLVYRVDDNGKMKALPVKNINSVLKNFICFLSKSKVLAGISPAFDAAFFGGVKDLRKIPREAFQFVLLKVENIKHYIGFHEEDTLLSILNFTNIYLIYYGMSFIAPLFAHGDGGIDYNDKSLSPPLFNYIAKPSAIKVTSFLRKIRYGKYCYPKIITDKFKK